MLFTKSDFGFLLNALAHLLNIRPIALEWSVGKNGVLVKHGSLCINLHPRFRCCSKDIPLFGVHNGSLDKDLRGLCEVPGLYTYM